MSKDELTKNRHLAKQSGYGTYIDFPFITTDSIVEGRKVIVGELADYIETLESICTKYEDGLQKLAVQEIIKDDKERLHAYDTVFSRIYTKLLLPPNPVRAEQEIYAMARNLEMGNYLCEQKDQQLAELKAEVEEYKTKCRECKRLNHKLELNIKDKLTSENEQLKAENFELLNKVDVLESEKENLTRTLEESAEELEVVKRITKQVCEKIRKHANLGQILVSKALGTGETDRYKFIYTIDKELLDEIEKGESNE